ncbi:hypothetical protein GCM10027081_15980 [Cupriavidus yeoncheonensis]|nr:hypothetical protein [Cupriavidus yeoncheonensis]
MASATPPAGNGTIRRIGRAGNDIVRAMAGGADAVAADTVCAAKGVPTASKAANTPNHVTAAFRMAAGSVNLALPRQSRDKMRTSDINFLRTSRLAGPHLGRLKKDSRQIPFIVFVNCMNNLRQGTGT